MSEKGIAKHNLLLLDVSQSYNPEKDSEEDLYDCVRGYWGVNLQNAEACDYICAIAKSEIRGVFVVEEWERSDGKFEWKGKVAPGDIQKYYIGRHINGTQQPIHYIRKGDCLE